MFGLERCQQPFYRIYGHQPTLGWRTSQVHVRPHSHLESVLGIIPRLVAAKVMHRPTLASRFLCLAVSADWSRAGFCENEVSTDNNL